MSAVYILASRRHGALYVGVTADLVLRISQHRSGEYPGFTQYRRDWKINLIERDNPDWADLYPALLLEVGPLSHLQPPIERF